MNTSLLIEAIIWGGEKNIPPMIRRKLGGYESDQEEIKQPDKY